MLNSFEKLCIMRAVAVNFFASVLNLNGGAYIYNIYIYIYKSAYMYSSQSVFIYLFF